MSPHSPTPVYAYQCKGGTIRGIFLKHIIIHHILLLDDQVHCLLQQAEDSEEEARGG